MTTFARTEPPDTQVTKSVIALLLHYGWNKFTIITESAWSTVARSLEEQATKNNLTVNHYKTVEDRHTCCEERLPCCQVSVWFQLIQETKNMTRSQSNFLYVSLDRQGNQRLDPSIHRRGQIPPSNVIEMFIAFLESHWLRHRTRFCYVLLEDPIVVSLESLILDSAAVVTHETLYL